MTARILLIGVTVLVFSATKVHAQETITSGDRVRITTVGARRPQVFMVLQVDSNAIRVIAPEESRGVLSRMGGPAVPQTISVGSVERIELGRRQSRRESALNLNNVGQGILVGVAWRLVSAEMGWDTRNMTGPVVAYYAAAGVGICAVQGALKPGYRWQTVSLPPAVD